MPNPLFRLTLDVPHRFAVEPGFMLSRHSHDMVPVQRDFGGTWRDANTGLIMLEPSFVGSKWYHSAYWQTLSSWTTDVSFWAEVFRGSANGITDPLNQAISAAHFFSILPNNASAFYDAANGKLTNALVNLAIYVNLLAIGDAADVLKWVLKSNFALNVDEGFVWAYHVTGDEMHRPKNWFLLQWDDIGLHFSYDGTVRVYRYDLANMMSPPTLWETFTIASPGDIINRTGAFVIIPIPGYGLSFYHSNTAQFLDAKSSTSLGGVTRGHLIRLWKKFDTNGLPVAHFGGSVNVAKGSIIGALQNTVGFHRIGYDTSALATFVDSSFDPGYKPAQDPTEVKAIQVPVSYPGNVIVSSILKNGDGSAPWTAGTDRQGRIETILYTNDGIHTPFLLGTGVRWNAVMNVRDTTPLTFGPPAMDALDAPQPDRLLKLSWTEDELARVEGQAEVFTESRQGRRLVERGDTTWQIESSDDGIIWSVVNGGLARLTDVHAYLTQERMHYRATWNLRGMEARFEEIHQVRDTAFDGVRLGEAIDVVLTTSGFAPLDNFPAGINAISLPGVAEGQSWAYGTRAGDSGEDIFKQLLLFLRKQNVEYRLRYDWLGQGWRLEARPRDAADAATWTLTPFDDELVLSPDRWALYGGGQEVAFSLTVDPPEANLIQPYGTTSQDHAGARVPGTPITNNASLFDNESVDYLGRVVAAFPLFAPISEVAEINKMGRRVFDAACHRRLKASLSASDYLADLKPNVRTIIRAVTPDGERTNLFTLWLKRRSVTLDFGPGGGGDVAPVIEYSFDSQWESEMEH